MAKMKKFVIGGVVFSIVAGGATVGKNYAGYRWIKSTIANINSEGKDRIDVQSLRWDWQGVYAEKVEIGINPEKHHKMQALGSLPLSNFQAGSVDIHHEWLKPTQIQVNIHKLQGPTLTADVVKGGVSHLQAVTTWSDLYIDKLQVQETDGSGKTITIPHVEGLFSYDDGEKKLDLDITIPSFEEKELEGVALRVNGNLKVKPELDGKMTVHLKGVEKFLEVLSERGLIKSGKHGLSKELIMMGGKLLGGKDDTINLPLNIEGRKVYLGPFLLFKLHKHKEL